MTAKAKDTSAQAGAMYSACLEQLIERLRAGPLEHADPAAVYVVARDALDACGFFDLVLMAITERGMAQAARDEAERWKGRAGRADNRDVCEHCGAKENLTRSAVSCHACLTKLLMSNK